MSTKILISTQLKALLRSNKTAQTALSFSKEHGVLLTNSDIIKVVGCPSLNPNCELFKILNLVEKLYKRLYKTFPIVLFTFGKIEFGRHFLEVFWILC